MHNCDGESHRSARDGRQTSSPYARLLRLVGTCLLLALIVGCTPQVAGPPLMVLAVSPGSEEGLPLDQALELVFNFPADIATLRAALSVQPTSEIMVSGTGTLVSIRLTSARAGQVYTLRINQDVRGTGGQRLAAPFQTSVFMVPEGTEISREPHPDVSASALAFKAFSGAQLLLDGSVVGACDLPGAYEVPRFDRLRIFLTGSVAMLEDVAPTLLIEGPGGALQQLDLQVSAGEGWVDLVPTEDIRIGATYACVLLTSLDAERPGLEYLWQFSVRGVPRTNVWALDLDSGRISPVGQLDLGYEVDALVGTQGGLIAAGTPGGLVWQGLQILQAVGDDLRPIGLPVAAIRSANRFERQFNQRLGVMIAVGPVHVPPLVGELAWTGYDPAEVLMLPPDELALQWRLRRDAPAAGQVVASTTSATAVIALGHGTSEPLVLLQDTEVDGGFISGPALNDDGRILTVSSQLYTQHLDVRSWRRALPLSWLSDQLTVRELDGLVLESSRAVYEQAYVGEYGYAGGTTWAGDSVWWDVYLPDGTAEVWRLGGDGGYRELVTLAALAPQPSPNGRYVLCRTAVGISIFTSDGELVRSAREQFAGATWLPDSSGVLLVGDRGISLVPIAGQTLALTSFGARPGCFVNGREYWFVSDRRL